MNQIRNDDNVLVGWRCGCGRGYFLDEVKENWDDYTLNSDEDCIVCPCGNLIPHYCFDPAGWEESK